MCVHVHNTVRCLMVPHSNGELFGQPIKNSEGDVLVSGWRGWGGVGFGLLNQLFLCGFAEVVDCRVEERGYKQPGRLLCLVVRDLVLCMY